MAIVKSIVINACYTTWDVDCGKGSTFRECKGPDTCDTIGDGHTRQTGAVRESRPSNALTAPLAIINMGALSALFSAL